MNRLWAVFLFYVTSFYAKGIYIGVALLYSNVSIHLIKTKKATFVAFNVPRNGVEPLRPLRVTGF